MRQRGDMACFHEPFGMAWYQGPDARAPRASDTKRPEATFEKIWDDIQAAAQSRPVFVKDMPHHTDHMWTDAFLDRITHSFLIRDPAKVLASLHRSYEKAGGFEGFEAHEISFGPQQALFDLLQSKGREAVVLDSDDLMESPAAMVKAYSEALGFPFIESALSWEPGSRSEVLWFDNNEEIWHASLRDSDGLKPIPRKYVDPASLPENLSKFHRQFRAHYEHLHAHRLKPDLVAA